MRTAFKVALFAGLLGLPTASLTADDKKPEAKKADEKPVVVPFELLKSRHMAVQVKVNGKGPYRLIFDTGAPMNLVTNKLAEDAGLYKGKKPGAGLFGSRGKCVMDTLEIGEVKLEKMSAMVMDHPTLMAIADVVGPLDGIIGFPVFSRYRMTIDYQKQELTLVPNGFETGDYLEDLTKKLMEMQKKKGSDPTIVAPAGVWGLVVTKEKDDGDPGVIVEEVLSGGAAAMGGLKPGDRLLTIDGRWTDTVSDTFMAASLVKPGREVEVVVRRDGKEVKLKVKPAKGT
ncbi:MAG TPA: PDZ domain-containing protein [Gemmataceae bacterium]|nr:PDZ domain-containing protein [Gemmataceae bacterium]